MLRREICNVGPRETGVFVQKVKNVDLLSKKELSELSCMRDETFILFLVSAIPSSMPSLYKSEK